MKSQYGGGGDTLTGNHLDSKQTDKTKCFPNKIKILTSDPSNFKISHHVVCDNSAASLGNLFVGTEPNS